MNESIDQILERIASINFFSNAGSINSPMIAGCDMLVSCTNSWEEALRLRGSDMASDAFQEASSRLTRRLSADFRKQFSEWNKIARRNRELFEEPLFPRIDEVVDAISELRTFENGEALLKDSVRWDLIHYAAEQAFSNVVKPAFYSLVIKVYEAGRFPCNWNEKWPDGRIWIF